MKPPAGTVIRSLDELQQDATPTRDLWPGIQAQLAPRRRSWMVPASIAASAALVTLGLFIVLQSKEQSLPTAALRESGALIRASLEDPAFQSQREALLRDIDAKMAALPPESRQRVLNSLTTIQSAVKDIETELGRETGNALLQELLLSTYQEEIRVLTTVGDFDGFNQEI